MATQTVILTTAVAPYGGAVTQVLVRSQAVTGPTGPTGPTGATGSAGAAATIAVGTVTTGAAGSSATVTNSGTSSAAVFDFTIPQGDAGTNGTNGTNGLGYLTAKSTNTSNLTSTSNTALTAITGLSLSVTSGRRYWIKAIGQFQSAATTTGLGLGWFNTVSTTHMNWQVRIQQGTAGTGLFYEAVSDTMGGVLVSASVNAANVNLMWQIEGYIQPSATGTIALGFRSEVSGSQVSLLPGSILIAADLG